MLSAACGPSPEGRRSICIFDRRFPNRARQERLNASGLDFCAFRQILSKTFSILSCETFVLVTTERTVLDAHSFLQLEHGATIYLLQTEDQVLDVAAEELINFTPHHDTIVESGTFKYYDSEGKKSLPYALADLIDNALSATVNNTGERKIEIRMLFDESLGKPAVIVLDNGCGMTSKQLNDWAVYRLSKFKRDKFPSDRGSYVRPAHVPRSLNSDISYFGVGGKQAVFYIGKSTRMISKSASSPDVHELVLSKALFEKKEKNKEDTYSTFIRNRKPGDFSHIDKPEERFLRGFIDEEHERESFTAVVITDVAQEHIHFLKENFEVWTRQLAHIYHYYIHGVNGNTSGANSSQSKQISTIDILVTLRAKSLRSPYVINLRNIHDDVQTLYIKAAVSTFEFKACTNPEAGIVEGIIRYHPFLYDKETYPEDPDAEQAIVDVDEDGYAESNSKKKKPVFECFWNGRLIPYTTVSEFDWCSQPPKGSDLPVECFSRFSGVLFTDDTFKVTENKLTFIDLEQKLKNKDTAFTFVGKGQRQQRTTLEKAFLQWIQDCHNKFDKQVKFMKFLGITTRTDIATKRKQHPWATFSSAEWDGRVFQSGQYVKSQKTNPLYYGTAQRFLLYGTHDGDVFAPGGQVEICLEPKALHGKTKIIPLSKLDRNATEEEIKIYIKNDEEKLPDKIIVDWPRGKPWPDNAIRAAGTILGPIQVNIRNKKGDSLSRIPSVGHGSVRRLSVLLRIVRHDPGGDQEVLSYTAPHVANHGFWFKQIENLADLGKYTLYLNAKLTEDDAILFGFKLPHFRLRFTIKEGEANQFDVGKVSSSLRIGVPFDIPLELKDSYGHPVEPPSNLTPLLHCSGLSVTYEKVNRDRKIMTIKNVRVRGILEKYQQPNPCDLKVTLNGLKDNSKTLSISLLAGIPHSIHLIPKDNPITIENGEPLQLTIIVQDEAGNTTAFPKTNTQCLVPGHPPVLINCSSGIGQHVSKPINVAIVDAKPQILQVRLSVPKQSSVEEVTRELLVLPSKRVCRMELHIQDSDSLLVRSNDKIQWMAGGVLENLFFKLYDEASRIVPVTAEMASKIKVNWTEEMNQADVIEGRLPDVQVQTKVQNKHFYQVSYQDQGVSISFTIVPIPDEPVALRATLPKCTARLGETLPEHIILELVDQYDNVSKTLSPSCIKEITAEGEGLDKSALTFRFQESSCSVLVTGVCFSSGTPGNREMSFKFKTFICHARLEVASGIPAVLKLVRGPTQPLQILNGHDIATPFVIQLCDKWGNPSPDQRVVVKLCHSPPGLKVTSNVSAQPVNAAGQAVFNVQIVSGQKGYYQLSFKGLFNKEPIDGPSVNLTILPDPNKPVKLNVYYDKTGTFTAGKLFPVFSVTVISDEGSPMTSFKPEAVSMYSWKCGVFSGKTPPNTPLELRCSKPMDNDKKDSFYFREKPIPEQVGKYTIQFCLREPKENIVLYSEQIMVNVVANRPVKLAPDRPPPTQVVSYSEDITKRTLVENMTLLIMDQYGNPAGQGLRGNVEICIKNSDRESNEQLPLLEGKDKCKTELLDGKAHISKLAITKNSPGTHGAKYIVLFTPVLPSGLSLDPYEFHFSFSNDASNQHRHVELSRRKSDLQKAIEKLTEQVNIRNNIIKEHNSIAQHSNKNEADLRNELNKHGLHIPENISIEDVDRIHKNKEEEAKRILNAPRRTFVIQNKYMGPSDVLGMVGELAWVKEDADAWVISWHIRGDMDCVITTTTAAARRIYDHTGGRQQVLPLDSVNASCRRPLPPLPHMQNGRTLFNPVGNPVYAVDVLSYPHHKEDCEILFRNLLANTIVIDDLHSANLYRQTVVSYSMFCPTILTRQGDRVTAKGKFGGTQNKAPPRHHINMFGAPVPDHVKKLQEDIGRLEQYRATLKRKHDNQIEYDQKCRELMPVIEKTSNQMTEMNKELEEIEQQLAPVKRVSDSSDAGTSGIAAKRSKFGFN